MFRKLRKRKKPEPVDVFGNQVKPETILFRDKKERKQFLVGLVYVTIVSAASFGLFGMLLMAAYCTIKAVLNYI